MARQILPIAGQIAGGMIGGPIGAAIGGALGGMVGSYVDPIRHQGPKLGEARMQTAQEGAYRPLVFGTGCVSGNIIHRSERKVVRHRERTGKGGRDTVDTERGYRTFAIRIAESHTPEGYGLLRIWENETLVYDVRPESEIFAESLEYANNFRFYAGTEDQLPDPDLEAYLGVGNVSAYRGTSYIVFGNYDLTDYGDMIPQFRFEVASGISYGDMSIYIALDRSGSMATMTSNGQTRWQNARESVLSLLDFIRDDAILSNRVDIAICLWGGYGSDEWFRQTIVRRSCDASSIDDLKAFVPASTPPSAYGTAFRAAVADAPVFFDESPPSLRRISLFITDGLPTYWSGTNWDIGEIANEHATEAGITLLSVPGLSAHAYNIDLLETGQTAKMDNTPLDGVPVLDGADPTALFESVKSVISSYSASLAGVVSWCHRRVAVPEIVFDVSELDDRIDGVVFANGYSSRDAITALLPIYNADASEFDRGSGYRINYVKRGAPVVRTLTVDDLADEPEETIREDPMERPRVLHLAFESPVTGYQAAKASIQRLSPDARLVNEVSTYVPVTFKDQNEAWRRADVQMRIAWTEVSGHRTFSISDAHLDVVPTDVLALSIRGQIQRLRVQEVEYTEGVLKLETVADRQSNYTSNVTGIPLPAPEPPPPSLMGPAALAILDIPAISDQHDRLGYYVAVCGTTEAYAGAVIQRQQNGEWNDVISLSRNQRAIMGVLENTVPAASPHYTDTTNIVSVALYMDDELESLSDSQWLNKGGAFALETAAGWEIMQYRDVEQDSNGVWHLKYLARGRLNTDPDEHLPGARFVLLDDVHFVDADVGMIGEHLTLRAAAVGRSPESADPQTITYQGNSQREFPCAHITAEVDSDGLSMTCVPRDRFGTEQHPVRSINHDGFRWTATDGSSTVTADTDTANASLDVSGLSLPITATVAQLNRFTGAGPEISEQIE